MSKSEKKIKENKKKETPRKYEEKLKIEGTLDDVLGISIPEPHEINK